MKKKIDRRKQKKRRAVITYIIVITLIIVATSIDFYYRPSFSTQVAVSGKEELLLSLKGISVIDEELINSDEKAFGVMNYSDGTRILAKTHVASLYSDSIDDAKISKIKELNEKINSLENNIKNLNNEDFKGESTTSFLLRKMKKISYYSQKGDFQSILKETDEIRTSRSNSTKDTLQGQLGQLINERNSLEAEITGHKTNYYSLTAGQIYGKTDGYESILKKSSLNNIDPATFDTLWNAQPVNYNEQKDGYVYGKIVNNYEVTLITVCNAEDIVNLKQVSPSNPLSIKSANIKNGSVPCASWKKSKEVDGRVVLELQVTESFESFLNERKIEFDLVLNTYSGLRIPKESIKEDDEGKYVFTISDGAVRRKPVKILYEAVDTVIIEEDNTKSKNVLLYDLVITKSKNVTDGTLVSERK